jgi:hypothetical protein
MLATELDDSITEIKEIGYGVGNIEVPTSYGDDENTQCFCKSVMCGKKTTYYIKTDKYTILYDPWALFKTQQETKNYGQIKPNFQYTKVPLESFNYYRKYLKTRNKAYFTHADRIFKNG